MKPAALLLPCLFLAACVPWTVRPLQQSQQPAAGKFDAAQTWSAKLLPALDSAATDALPLFANATFKPGQHAAVRGAAIVLDVRLSPPSSALVLDLLPADGRPDALLQIGPELRGSALRDATSTINFSQFVNQIDFANAASALNRHAVSLLPPPAELHASKGRTLEFTGAVTFPGAGPASGLPAIAAARFRWSGVKR